MATVVTQAEVFVSQFAAGVTQTPMGVMQSASVVSHAVMGAMFAAVRATSSSTEGAHTAMAVMYDETVVSPRSTGAMEPLAVGTHGPAAEARGSGVLGADFSGCEARGGSRCVRLRWERRHLAGSGLPRSLGGWAGETPAVPGAQDHPGETKLNGIGCSRSRHFSFSDLTSSLIAASISASVKPTFLSSSL